MRRWIGAALLVLAYGLLYPGLNLPVLSVSGTVEKQKLVTVGKQLIQESPNTPSLLNSLVDRVVDSLDVSGDIDAFDKTRSILGTAQELYSSDHRLVAALIVLFSVLVPLVKALLLLSVLVLRQPNVRQLLLNASDTLSKWSMADVFVIALFIAYLASNGIRDGDDLVQFDATLGPGFWYFLGYCLISILGTQILSAGIRRQWSTSRP